MDEARTDKTKRRNRQIYNFSWTFQQLSVSDRKTRQKINKGINA